MNHGSPSSTESAQFSMRGLLIAVAIVAVVVACFSVLMRWEKSREMRRRAEFARREKLNKQTTAAIVKDVEAIRAELGRAPKDQAELEELLERSMPVIHHEYGESEIEYRRTGEDSFTLQYMIWDYWIYDSNVPNAGWVYEPW